MLGADADPNLAGGFKFGVVNGSDNAVVVQMFGEGARVHITNSLPHHRRHCCRHHQKTHHRRHRRRTSRRHCPSRHRYKKYPAGSGEKISVK